MDPETIILKKIKKLLINWQKNTQKEIGTSFLGMIRPEKQGK